eukprot:NODE_8309_length_415_cov_126.259563_g7440_i0.p3 GENE.NODE_8309_length_415_cov_126.259563_g7440_i0~~NODE_8309_length_415_cov_126.259563_g7440_i0.p3  ORF type:complete len:57 (+),score=13.34 NODE_8309_length_415_cov_126.259563_g7440_i0:136-306(+)
MQSLLQGLAPLRRVGEVVKLMEAAGLQPYQVLPLRGGMTLLEAHVPYPKKDQPTAP